MNPNTTINNADPRADFEVYKSHVCHQVKHLGALLFIVQTLESDEIRKLYDRRWYPECLYLLAMLDYQSRLNDLPLCTNYNDLRAMKLNKELFPASLVIFASTDEISRMRERCRREAIPEFRRFNIMESDIDNVI